MSDKILSFISLLFSNWGTQKVTSNKLSVLTFDCDADKHVLYISCVRVCLNTISKSCFCYFLCKFHRKSKCYKQDCQAQLAIAAEVKVIELVNAVAENAKSSQRQDVEFHYLRDDIIKGRNHWLLFGDVLIAYNTKLKDVSSFYILEG